MNSVRFISASNKVNNFFGSWWSVITLSIIATIFGIIQITAFISGKLEINGITNDGTISGQQLTWAWIVTIAGVISCYLSFYQCILYSNSNYKFIFPFIVTQTCVFIVQWFAGMVLMNVEIIISTTVAVIWSFYWKHDLLSNPKFTWDNMKKYIRPVVVFIIVAMLVVCGVWGEQIYNGTPLDGFRYQQWFDAIAAGLWSVGYIYLIFKLKRAFLFYEIGRIPFIALYVMTGNITNVVLQVITTIIDAGTIMAWFAQALNKSEVTYA